MPAVVDGVHPNWPRVDDKEGGDFTVFAKDLPFCVALARRERWLT